MKTIFYFVLISLCFSLNISAQEKYSTMIMEDWAGDNWVYTVKVTNTFDSNGTIIKENNEIWDNVAKAWKSASLTTHTLNSNSTINYSITETWNEVLGAWEEMQKMVYTYDASKKVLTMKMQMFFGADWMDLGLTTNVYNANGELITTINQNYDFMTMGMVNSSQTSHTYNPDGTETQSISQSWNALTGSWGNTSRTTNAYISGKKLSSMIMENFTDGVWVNFMKSSMTYNGDGSMKESLSQDWNSSSGIWVDEGKSMYTLYSDGSINQMLMTEWIADQSKWDNQSRITYTYKTTSINQLETDMVRVFPNPFTNSISIESSSTKVSSFQIYNTSGQLVRTIEKGEPLSSVNLSALKRGVYLLKVNTLESQKVIKLMKNE
jgi:hypothetical protein